MAVTEEQPRLAEDREKPEFTGATDRMGHHEPLKRVRKVPKYFGWLALFGPGAIYAATAQGSGELIFWPLLIALFGPALIGLILPACALQLPVTIEIGRYTATTGETMFTGFQRINRAFAVLMWIMLFVVYLWFGGYASGAAGGMVALTGFPPGLSEDGQTYFWAYLIIAVFASVIIFGKTIYPIIEKIMIVITAITILGLIIASFHPAVRPYYGEFFGRLFTFRFSIPDNLSTQNLDYLITAIAFAGQGGFGNVLYSYWIRDKGIGMGRFAGRITSPVTGEPETIPSAGYTFEDTEANKKEYRGWTRWLWADQSFGTGANTVTLVLTTLLSFALLWPKGAVPSDDNLVSKQAAFFETSWGTVGKLVFFLVATAFLADTWLALVDAVSRMHSDFFTANFKRLRRWGFRNVYYTWFVILTLVSVITIPFATPGTLLVTVAVLQFFAMMFYIPGLIYMNYYKIPKVYPKWTRPSNIALFFISLSGLVYIVLGVLYLKIRGPALIKPLTSLFS
ncbi:MAG: Nramp family divalent metal transporter [Actinobacteria bacterium]|nr:Nramp family divalent metal transporter [Actinomycetota bacterium]